MSRMLIKNGHIIDTERGDPSDSSDILIDNGRIVEIDKAEIKTGYAEIIDARGAFCVGRSD